MEIPPELDNMDKYKAFNRNCIRKFVKEDDKVGIIGGGWGGTIYEALQITPDVTAYEPAQHRVERIKEQIDAETLELHHAYVRKPRGVPQGLGGAKEITSLPDFDVVEMDIEGAEIEVLGNLEIRPRIIIVETHPNRKAPTEKVVQLLKDLGYEIIEKGQGPYKREGHTLIAK